MQSHREGSGADRMNSDAWSGKDVLSILDFSRSNLDSLFELANRFLNAPAAVRSR